MSNIHILTGLGDILNHEHLKPGMDVKSLEQQLINGGVISKSSNSQDKFSDELSELSRNLGIDLENMDPSQHSLSSLTPKQSSANKQYIQKIPSSFENSSNTSSVSLFPQTPNIQSSSSLITNNNSAGPIDSDPIEAPDAEQEFKFNSYNSNSEDHAPFKSSSSLSPSQHSLSPELAAKTVEQQRRDHIASVHRDLGGHVNEFSFENEKKEEIKDQMLEEIDSLRQSLQNDEGLNLSRIPEVNSGSTFEEIGSVLRMLRYKSDRVRYCSLAEEFLLFGAHGLEELFNGRNVWFGRKPDLTGWHNNVNAKLRRMRHDTSLLVSNVMHDYNIGPGFRLLLELVPNGILYSKLRTEQHGMPALYTRNDIQREAEYTNAIKKF